MDPKTTSLDAPDPMDERCTRIPDLRNVLDEISRPLQGTATEPAFQRPLTPPDSDYSLLSATISLALPHELVERILLLLDTKSKLKCRLANREFNTIIQSSTLVQYHLACEAAGVIDNPQSPLSYSERLEALKRREDAWRQLTPVFETTIKIIDQPSIPYELTAGNYFIYDKHRKDLYYCPLPSFAQDNPQWLRIPGHGYGLQSWPGSIIDSCMAIYEHDLVVNVISSEIGNQADMQRHSLDLVLLKCSTGEYHPLARHPLIHVQRSSSSRPQVTTTIVGDNFAFVYHDRDGSKLFIFDWKTGHKRLQHEATDNAYEYSGPVFISPELLLVPNCILSHFEVWHLSPSHLNPPVQILSFQIPAVSINYSLGSIYCYGELTPFLHSIPSFPQRPFFPSSENSIIIVNLRFESVASGIQKPYKLIMYRRALLDMIQKWTSPSLLEQQVHLPTWLTNEVTVHKVTDPDDGSVRVGAQSELVWTMPDPESPPLTLDSPTLATSQISSSTPTNFNSSANSSGSTSSKSRYYMLEVQWADWGPPVSRWFQLNGVRIEDDVDKEQLFI